MISVFETATKVYTYKEFVQLADDLLAEGKTTGTNQSEEYLFYAKLNLQRMHRWDKTFELRDDVREKVKTVSPQTWWVITEGWCGDSAQNLPAIAKIAEASGGNIKLWIVLRDENPQIMDQYLTKGSRSIPILAATDDASGKELFRWGPRPVPAQKLLMEWKNDPQPESFEAFEKKMHTWYTKDKGNTLLDELMLEI
jgi:hypothetical protein